MSERPSSPPGFDPHSGRIPAPSYHSSLGIGPTPSYTRYARLTEQVIAQGATRRRLNGVYNRPGKQVSLSLNGQEPNCAVPMFGRGSLVEGVVTLDAEAARNVLQLEVMIEGDMKLVIAEGGTITHPLLSISIPLLYSASPIACSETHPFSCRLPIRFDDSGVQRPLPPTYEVNFPGVPGIRAAVRYWMTVKFVRKNVWKRKEFVTVPFTYYPRARPPQPIVGLSFLSSIKSHPEEWSLFTSTIAPRNPRTNATVTSSFILPSTTIFPMSRKIPFHLQLSLDPSTSSRTPEADLEPLSPSKQISRTSNDSPRLPKSSRFSFSLPSSTRKSFSSESPHSPRQQHHLKKQAPAAAPTLISSLLTRKAVIKVTLQRQISVDVRNQRVLKTVVCGEGFMHRVHLGSNSSPGGSPSGSMSSPMSHPFEPTPTTIVEEDGVYTDLNGAGPSNIHNNPEAGADIDEVEVAGHGEYDDVDQDWAGWEGEVVPSKQIDVGGFRAAGLTIRDFIILTLIPPDPQTSPLRAHQHAVPVRIVTDAWEGDEEPLGAFNY